MHESGKALPARCICSENNLLVHYNEENDFWLISNPRKEGAGVNKEVFHRPNSDRVALGSGASKSSRMVILPFARPGMRFP
jgi:hypothetical protein